MKLFRQIERVLKQIKKNLKLRELRDKLGFYPPLTVYDYNLTFEEVNEYCDLQYEIRITESEEI